VSKRARAARDAGAAESYVTAARRQADPLRALLDLKLERAQLLEQERRLIGQARDSGCTWAVIGAALGTTGQAAQQRAATNARHLAAVREQR